MIEIMIERYIPKIRISGSNITLRILVCLKNRQADLPRINGRTAKE
jgi:hypothetical protein